MTDDEEQASAKEGEDETDNEDVGPKPATREGVNGSRSKFL